MKQSLISLIIFLAIVAICRHIVSDIKQEERITVLENQIIELNKAYIKIQHNSQVFTTNNIAGEKAKKLTKDKTGNTRTTTPTSSGKKTNDTVWQHQPDNKTITKVILGKDKEQKKFTNPIFIELNTVDSATLTRIPGIGAKTAEIILRYRQQLGGYYDPRQIGEKLTWESATDNIDQWCTKWLKADSSLIKKISINNASFKELLRHPYLNYEQTKDIVNYRDRHKRINSLKVFEMFETFSDEDIKKIEHYLIFE